MDMAGPSDPPNQPLTRDQALSALRDLEGFEEGLTARVGALTGMVWGVVSAGIFVSYGLATQGDIHNWLMLFLWLPWAAAGTAITSAVWKLHAVTLRGPKAKGRSWVWSCFFAVFFAMALLVLHLTGGVHVMAFPYMLVVNGLVAFILVGIASRKRGRLTAGPLLAAGVLMVASAFALSAAGITGAAMSFASAAVVGVAFVGSGIVGFIRG
jgi:hypothetical protein